MNFWRSIILSAGLLAGCANLTGTQPPEPTAANDPVSLERDERFAELAALKLGEASQLSGLARLPPLRTAAWAAARAENPNLLREALNLFPNLSLRPADKAVYDTYDALLLVLQDQPALALQQLDRSVQPESDRALADYWLARAMAYRQLDDGEAATAMLVRRNAHLDEAGRNENAARIWDLQQEPARFLLAAGLADYDDQTQGWLDLGRIARGFWSDDAALQRAIENWQRRYPGHPAAASYLGQATGTATETLRTAVRRIAVLLPTGGALSGAATALRDGFLAAHYLRDAPDLEIRFYDSSRDPVASYEEALADGAELIIGPLDKDGVAAVIRHNAGLLPILALNYLEQPPTDATLLLQYGLSPEDEARSVASRALADGHTRAIALASPEDWSQRALQAFRESFESQGGQLLDIGIYRGGPRDYPTVIQPLLKLDESRARGAALERLLGTELSFEPVRRQDAQFLFLAASPTQGRQLRPQLRFYHASNLPVYATDRIYAGEVNPRLDKDLNGVRFCAMPWLLDNSEAGQARRDQVANLWPRRADRYARLFAMGHDAYLLASRLRQGNWERLPNIPGATGELTRQGDRIVRSLPCARFVDGQPRPLPPRES